MEIEFNKQAVEKLQNWLEENKSVFLAVGSSIYCPTSAHDRDYVVSEIQVPEELRESLKDYGAARPYGDGSFLKNIKVGSDDFIIVNETEYNNWKAAHELFMSLRKNFLARQVESKEFRAGFFTGVKSYLRKQT